MSLTAMNMLPMGQLDGGHVINALFPKEQNLYPNVQLFVVLCWIFLDWLGHWGGVALITGAYQPIPIAEYLPSKDRLSKRSLIIAYCAFCVILSFVPIPIAIESISISDIQIR